MGHESNPGGRGRARAQAAHRAEEARAGAGDRPRPVVGARPRRAARPHHGEGHPAHGGGPLDPLPGHRRRPVAVVEGHPGRRGARDPARASARASPAGSPSRARRSTSPTPTPTSASSPRSTSGPATARARSCASPMRDSKGAHRRRAAGAQQGGRAVHRPRRGAAGGAGRPGRGLDRELQALPLGGRQERRAASAPRRRSSSAAHELNILYEIEREMNAAHDLDELLRPHPRPGDGRGARPRPAAIALREPSGAELRFRTVGGPVAARLLHRTIPIGEGVIGWVGREPQGGRSSTTRTHDERHATEFAASVGLRAAPPACRAAGQRRRGARRDRAHRQARHRRPDGRRAASPRATSSCSP